MLRSLGTSMSAALAALAIFGSALGARAVAYRTDTLSVVMCGMSRADPPITIRWARMMIDDELDAARHFIFTADFTMNLVQDRA
jgi:hypothetical protein